MKRPRWTPAEDATLRRLYGHVKQAEIAKRLGKTLGSVYGRCHYLGLVGGFATGRGRMPACDQYLGPRLTIQKDGLPTGVVRVVRHRLRG